MNPTNPGNTVEVIILAAGKGSRMKSRLPKSLHTIGGKPLLTHVLDTASSLKPEQIHIVVGYGADLIQQEISQSRPQADIRWVSQAEPLGTGHAVQQALPNITNRDSSNTILVLFGDVPLITGDTLQRVVASSNPDSIGLLSFITEQPAGFGRIIRDQAGQVTAIVEERDATDQQKQITEVNSGIMAIPAAHLEKWLGALQNRNEQQEYYLTDIVSLATADNREITTITTPEAMEVMGVNDRRQLASLERYFQMTKTTELLDAGVTLRDPSRVEVRGEVTCGQDTEIDCNVILEGNVTIGSNVKIGANVIIRNSRLADDVTILPGTLIEDSSIGRGASVGPMARIRPGTELGEATKIGNFVETKNAKIGKGSKASHLAYLGDVELGENCNIGAGTIVCNYDGVNKHKTVLGNNVFVGSNSVLVAPVELADNAFVAAGSAVNANVPENNLAVGRAKQRNIAGWKRLLQSHSGATDEPGDGSAGS